MTKGQLSAERRGLVEAMQRIRFGRIENLIIKGGEPQLDPPPRIVRERRFGAEAGRQPSPPRGDFTLKAEVVELFAEFSKLGNGTIELLDVRHGLPFRVVIAETVAMRGGS